MTVNVIPYSLAETRLMSKEIQTILKERFGMKSQACALGILFGLDKNRYTITFNTRDNALKAAKWLNDILKNGSQNKQLLL